MSVEDGTTDTVCWRALKGLQIEMMPEIHRPHWQDHLKEWLLKNE